MTVSNTPDPTPQELMAVLVRIADALEVQAKEIKELRHDVAASANHIGNILQDTMQCM